MHWDGLFCMLVPETVQWVNSYPRLAWERSVPAFANVRKRSLAAFEGAKRRHRSLQLALLLGHNRAVQFNAASSGTANTKHLQTAGLLIFIFSKRVRKYRDELYQKPLAVLS